MKEYKIELSHSELTLIDAAVYRFAKDNKIDMGENLYNDCRELYTRLRKLEGLPDNFDVNLKK